MGLWGIARMAVVGAGALVLTNAGAEARPLGFGSTKVDGGGAQLVGLHWRGQKTYLVYPRDYWWYYRPYDYGRYNYYPRGRPLPYFHYLQPAYPRGAYPGREVGSELK